MAHRLHDAPTLPLGPEHPMRFYARVSEDSGGYTAACDSVDLTAWGSTRAKAIDDLLAALQDAYGHVEAMAPPLDATPLAIELVVLD